MELVIARYNENLTWLSGLENLDITIYNKGDAAVYLPNNSRIINLDNIGREAHSYLTHIIRNYDNLADYTIFCFGNPFDHSNNFLSELHEVQNNNPEKDCYVFQNTQFGILTELLEHKYPFPNNTILSIGNKFIEMYEELFNIKYINTTIKFTPAAIWMLKKELIQNRGIEFYKKLLDYTEKDYYAPWTLERLWELIWK